MFYIPETLPYQKGREMTEVALKVIHLEENVYQYGKLIKIHHRNLIGINSLKQGRAHFTIGDVTQTTPTVTGIEEMTIENKITIKIDTIDTKIVNMVVITIITIVIIVTTTMILSLITIDTRAPVGDVLIFKEAAVEVGILKALNKTTAMVLRAVIEMKKAIVLAIVKVK